MEPSLPIAIMNKPCIFRDASLAALEKAGLPYTIALETPSISVLRAAVDSGLAVTCRTSALFGHSRKPLHLSDTTLPKVAYSVVAGEQRAAAGLVDLLKVALDEL
ncbi:MAG: LysR family transcriptional regulator, partial [Hyphomicrobiales bacterium]